LVTEEISGFTPKKLREKDPGEKNFVEKP